MKISNIFIVFISSIITLFVFEILIKNFLPQNLNGYYQEQNDKSNLWVLKKNYKYIDYFRNEKILYESGNFRNRIIADKIDGRKKIMVLGDSFTFGEKIPTKDTYVYKLQNTFNNYFFINSAVPGWGLSNYSRYVEDYCNQIKPKKIIIFFNTDDIGRVRYSNQYFLKNEKLERGSDPKFSPWYKKYQNKPIINFFLSKSHLFYLVSRTILNFSNFIKFKEQKNMGLYPYSNFKNNYEVEETIHLSKLIFLQLKENAHKCGAELYIIYSGWINYAKIISHNNPTIKFLFEFDDFFKKINIKYFNNVDSYHMQDVHYNLEKYILPKNHHPNKLGAEKIYQVAYENLKKFLE